MALAEIDFGREPRILAPYLKSLLINFGTKNPQSKKKLDAIHILKGIGVPVD